MAIAQERGLRRMKKMGLMKFKKFVCLIAACCLLAGCGKKNNNPSDASDTADSSAADAMTATDAMTTDTMTTTAAIPENTQTVTQNIDIPEDAVLKVTETTYRNDEVWEKNIRYKNAHDDMVAWGLGLDQYGGKEVLTYHNEYKYDDNGKKIYKKSISNTGSYDETEYRDNVEKTKSYDRTGRLDAESEATFDEYGNHIMSHTIVYDEDGSVSLEMIEDYSDCDYDENGKILVCRERSETGEVIATTTNTYDENGNLLLSEKISPDSKNYHSICHSYEYDDKNNLISVQITESNTDTDHVAESYEYQYDENGKKVRQNYRYVYSEADTDFSEYTIYEYKEL